MVSTEARIREIRKGTLKWYPFKKNAYVLFVGDECDPLYELLDRDIDDMSIDRIDAYCLVDRTATEHLRRDKYDYIIAIESLEQQPDISYAMKILSSMMTQDGHMILGFNNRLGLRYFLGDRDIYTRQNYDGIEDYRRAYSKKEDKFLGRCYDKSSIIDVLEEMELQHSNYSILPDFSNIQLILRDDYYSNEDLSIRVFPTYNYPQTVFLEEEYIYNSLQRNSMLHSMANCFLFDCTHEGELPKICQVTSSMGRDKEDAFFTIVRQDEDEDARRVIKTPAYSEGTRRLKDMVSIAEKLSNSGVGVIDMQFEDDGTLSMPYIEAPTAQIYFRQLASCDEQVFINKLDEFVEVVLHSSEVVEEDKGDGEGAIVSRGYLDLMPLNCFYLDDRFVFFDQEFCEKNYPINAILYRVILCLGEIISSSKMSITMEDLLERYNLIKKREKWQKMQNKFIANLRKDQELAEYYTRKRRDSEQVYSNRIRMNYSSEEYMRRFVNIFEGLDNKKLVIFGTGRYADQFMNMYGEEYKVERIIDNNKVRQGSDFYGVRVEPPSILNDYNVREYRVIVCIKNFLSVVHQLEEMGVEEYGIFDPSQVYRRQRKPILAKYNGQATSSDDDKPKKYHIGYIAGVFDLFHVGHLEKFKLAKEQCDYLIVGLVSDEGVIKHKETTPFVPFNERKAMLEACRYVDEVVKIPLDYAGTREAWRMYGFDVQFSGSDYIDDPSWLAKKEFLEQHGVDMVFFPYTESTSSSKLKKLIDEKLI